MCKDSFQQFQFDFVLFVARLCHALRTAHLCVDGFDVGKNQFEIDCFHVGHRVDFVGNVRDVAVHETAHHVYDRGHLADVRQKFIAQSFAMARALDKTRDVHETQIRRRDFFTVVQCGKFVQTFVGDGNNADVRLYCAKRVVGDFRPRLCDCIEKCAFADVGQTYYSQFH